MISALEALTRLRDGNQRFSSGLRSVDSMVSQAHSDLSLDQQPHAVILGCSDARVPAELIFDQGLGDLFVIRVAGNIVAPSQVGSVEFATDRHQIRLVVVMGHSMCAAISTTLDELDQPDENRSPYLRAIVDRIRPHIESLHETELHNNRDVLLKAAIRANVRACVDHLKHGSQILEQMIENDGLMIVGAEYDIESGKVEFFDGAPPPAP